MKRKVCKMLCIATFFWTDTPQSKWGVTRKMRTSRLKNAVALIFYTLVALFHSFLAISNLFELSFNDDLRILSTHEDNTFPTLVACCEWKYQALVDYGIIFRTIFFTWLPECIKKIAYLLCGSVCAEKPISKGLSEIVIFKKVFSDVPQKRSVIYTTIQVEALIRLS